MKAATSTLAVLAGLVYLSGCATLPSPAVERIKQADRAYHARRYAVAEQLLTPIIETHSDKPDIGEALYLRALCRLETDRPTEARTDLKQALHVTRRNELVDRLHAQLGNLAFDKGRYKSAAVYYKPSYDDLPDYPPKDRIGYQYGLALQRVGRFAEARTVLTDVYAKFPSSGFAPKARLKAAWLHDYFTIQCGAYRQIAGAHQQAKSLKDQGVDALAVPSSNLYLVRVGRYRTYSAAQLVLPLVKRVQPDAFIVP